MKRQREQAKREKQQMKLERRAQRAAGAQTGEDTETAVVQESDLPAEDNQEPAAEEK